MKAVIEGTTEAHKLSRSRYKISIENKMESGTWMNGWEWGCWAEADESVEEVVWSRTTAPLFDDVSSFPSAFTFGAAYSPPLSSEGLFGCCLKKWTVTAEMMRERRATRNTPTSMTRYLTTSAAGGLGKDGFAPENLDMRKHIRRYVYST